MEHAWSYKPEQVLHFFRVREERGLSHQQVQENRSFYGANVVPKEEATPLWKLILEQFKDRLVLILLAAAFVSFLFAIFEDIEGRLSAFFEPIVILLILIANATVGVIQETNAEKAIEALKEYEAETATVLREGHLISVPSADLVPGDIIEVSVGERVPADCRIVRLLSSILLVDQSIITGESLSVSKSIAEISDQDAVIQDKHCILFSGTDISRGKCRAVVVKTGSGTEIGKIRRHLSQTEEVTTPLKRKLDEFSGFLSKVILVICILIWFVNMGNFKAHGSFLRGALYYFKIAVALAVAAIPEGLPAVVTTCLALGTRKMASRNAIIRSLPSVETLGCTSVICTDKTGTLTTNQMSVERVIVFDGIGPNGLAFTNDLEVTGATYSPEGLFKKLSGREALSSRHRNGEMLESQYAVLKDPAETISQVAELACISTLCNDSSLFYNEERQIYEKLGEPTEVALTVLAEKIGVPDSSLNNTRHIAPPEEKANFCRDFWLKRYEKIATLEFTRDRKSMSVLVKDKTKTGKQSLFVKGAPESIFERCTGIRIGNGKVAAMTTELREQLNRLIIKLSTGVHSLRCLALAVRDDIHSREEFNLELSKCKVAGIRVVVITGDNKATAETICRRVGIFDEYEDLDGKSFTGREFDGLLDDQKRHAVLESSLFSRTEPVHKQKLVDLLKSFDEVVAMTGDGVNDAPALKKADIGIAMGSGTAVAKGAADMVLADDNFATIVAAVEEGRAIYNNMKQFIRYLISSNIGEVVCIFTAAFLGMPEALIPVQLLWVNLVTDGLPATALSFNAPEKDIMLQAPRKANESIVDGWLFMRYLVVGTYVGVGTVAGFIWWFLYYSRGPQMTWSELLNFESCRPSSTRSWSCEVFQDREASTIALSILVTIEMLNALNSLSENQSIFVMSPFSNPLLILAIIVSFILHFMILYIPFFQKIFSVAPLNFEEWMAVVWLSFPVILLDEMLKFVSRKLIQGSIRKRRV
ncbi:Sarcoplasmic/endoplasmic reticulum calcium ATPase 3 [Galdieria sulphuraria]|nr:Sarcoplasmic/endoplasmic reticulum calcium ATPase 3 [Galdieria sulphuraria]